MRRVLIVGATSAIAQACARIFAERGDALYLWARNEERLSVLAQDLRVRGAQAPAYAPVDVNTVARHGEWLDAVYTALGELDVVLIAHGTLPEQIRCQQDVALTLQELHTNAICTLALLTDLANRMERSGQGTLAVISSVAGDRGRKSNYVYGAAKGMVTLFLQGLRNRLHAKGVHVLTVKPGFVDTPMTRDFKKGLLWAQPEAIAAGIIQAIDKNKDVVYLPWFWRYIMWIIASIPERIFKRLSI